jgi:hypothetical protein
VRSACGAEKRWPDADLKKGYKMFNWRGMMLGRDRVKNKGGVFTGALSPIIRAACALGAVFAPGLMSTDKTCLIKESPQPSRSGSC